MKKLIASILFALSSLAHAGSVDNMVAQCEAVHVCQMCAIYLDQTVYTTEVKQIFLKKVGLRNIKIVDYNWLRNAQNVATADHKWLMCERVREAMQQPDSPHGIAARSFFDDEWVKRDYCPPQVQVKP